MNHTQASVNVVFRTQNYELGTRNRLRLEAEAGKLQDLIADFPVADLHVDIHAYPKHPGFHVKTSLRLPNDTLFTGDRHVDMHSAYLRCIRKLMLKVKAYKAKLAGEHRYGKTAEAEADFGTDDVPDAFLRLAQAVDAQDFHAFRAALAPWEPTLRETVAAFCGEDDHAAMMIGHGFNRAELLEEIALNAYEHFGERGRIQFEAWLQDWVETSFGKLVADPKFERHRLEAMR